MLVHELCVEQHETTRLEPRHQMHQCDLAGVALDRKHALPEKGAAERDAISAADQRLARPDLGAVRVSHVMHICIQSNDAVADPGIGPRFGAMPHHRFKGAVKRDGMFLLAHRFCEAMRHMKGIERQNAALRRVVPAEFRIMASLRHREYSHGIGAQQHVGRDLVHAYS